MKVLESAPERYDRGMRLLTLGRLEQVHREIAARLNEGDRVLDLGCGTGALVATLADKGVCVTGIDISPPMLSQAAQRVREEGLEELVALREMGAVDLDTAFPDGCFDAVVSTLVFSELSDDEIAYTLTECHRILAKRGGLFVADEVMPDSRLGRVGTFVFRLPFTLAAFVLTQNTTHRVARLDRRIEQAGFRISDTQGYLAGTLRLFVAEKVAVDA
jgi:demethylmenaquinone methyltransferase/2-methoxy-6-polyprenyl-1,4-benzoquinol methylase